jgi:hypothetical protein
MGNKRADKADIWLAVIALACEEQIDTSDLHPELAMAVDRVQHLRIALQVLCLDYGHEMAEVLDACKKPEDRAA